MIRSFVRISFRVLLFLRNEAVDHMYAMSICMCECLILSLLGEERSGLSVPTRPEGFSSACHFMLLRSNWQVRNVLDVPSAEVLHRDAVTTGYTEIKIITITASREHELELTVGGMSVNRASSNVR